MKPDQLATGRKLRVLTIVDTFSRFSPANQIKTLTFEELINKTEQTLTELFRRLNVEHSTAWGTVPPENVTPETIKQRKGFGLLSGLRNNNRLLRVTIDSAPELIGALLFGWFRAR